MKKEITKNYYTDEDLINFKKLDHFKNFKNNNLKNEQKNAHPVKYSMSDNNYFKKIMNTENTSIPSSKEHLKLKEKNYYNSSDFQKFNNLKQFTNFNNDNEAKNKNEYTKNATIYTSDDVNKFNKIIKIKNKSENRNEINSKKIRVIDFDKLNKKEKKIKNKVGIEKIKVVYFD